MHTTLTGAKKTICSTDCRLLTLDCYNSNDEPINVFIHDSPSPPNPTSGYVWMLQLPAGDSATGKLSVQGRDWVGGLRLKQGLTLYAKTVDGSNPTIPINVNYIYKDV